MSNLAIAHFQLRQFDQAMAIGIARGRDVPDQPAAPEQRRAVCDVCGQVRGGCRRRQEGSRAEQGLRAGVGVAGPWRSKRSASTTKPRPRTQQLSAIPGLGGAGGAWAWPTWRCCAAGRRSGERARADARPKAAARSRWRACTPRSLRCVSPRAARLTRSSSRRARHCSWRRMQLIRFEAGRVLLAAGRAPRAKEIAAELDKSLSPETQALGLTLTGEIQLNAGDARAAVHDLPAKLEARGCVADALPARSRLPCRRRRHPGRRRVRCVHQPPGRGDGGLPR